MRKLKLLIAACALLLGAGQTWADVSWTDKTSLITNPSFETDDAIANLKDCGWATDRVTGWTIAPSSSSNAQVGVGNSSSTIQGIGDTFSPYAGDKYFYTRNNWNKDTNYSFSQVITRDGDNLKAGLYKLTCKAATYSSNAAFNTLTLGLKEGTGSAVTHDGIILNVWNTWGVIIYKRADATNLTIEVNFKPGYAAGGSHYALLMDDFHLEYISEADAFAASSSNTIDFSDIINNAGIYNHSTQGTCPRGWTASKHTTGNGNYTEGANGDTRLEGWSGGNLDIDYNQTITNLPAGTYTVTAYAHERAEVGRTYVYASTEGQEDATGLVNSATDSDITTSGLKVSNGTMKIGIRSTANDWVTADDFRISFLGFDVDAVKSEYETAYTAATTARDADENENIVGTERTTFEGVITTYTTDATQSYSWYVNAKEALENATAAFISVRDSYDALAREIEKAAALGIDASEYAATSSSTAASALTATQNIKVAEYIFVEDTYQYGVELGEWTSTGTNTKAATFNNEHWSGTEHDYKNQDDSNGQGWNANSWEINFSQDVTLPAGNYVFKVAGRQASGNAVNTSLVVKLGETELGSVNDFPRSNNALGINKDGATSFDPDDEAGFANSGNGYGWEWRYVKFSLSEGATVNIAIHSVATASHQWVSFGDYTVQTDNEANISLIAYNVALGSAQTTIADDNYTNVTGNERTTLQAAIDADSSLDKTDNDAIVYATTALDNAREAFVAAKSAYDGFVAAKTADYSKLPYASADKFTAIATAQSAADATSASDATDKTNAILSAYRKYVESNALAEGVTGAEDKTSLINDPNFAGVSISGTTAGAWTFDQTGGNVNINSNEPFTDGDGNSNYSYFDYYNGSNNNQNLHQDIEDLAPGRYILTVTGRGHSNFNGNLQLYVVGKGNVNIPAIGNSGGTFDRGWNDVTLEFAQTETSNITIGVKTNNSQPQWWGATRFRLVKLPTPEVTISESDTSAPTAQPLANVTLNRTLDAGYWNTFSVPFDMAIPSGWTVKEFDSAAENVINFKEATTIVAGKPYLVKPEETVENPTYNGVTVQNTEGTTDGTGDYKFAAQIYNKSLATDGTIAYLATDGSIKKLNSATGLKGLRAYFIIPAGSGGARIAFIDGDQTGIKDSFVETTNDNRVYDLQGRQVKAVKKGIYVVNGKKVIK